MPESNLNIKSFSFSELLGNEKYYYIPRFHNDYCWDHDEWDVLWNDLLNIYENNQTHCMGSILLKEKGEPGDKAYWVIDGQQRITTLSLFTLAVINKIKSLAKAGIETNVNLERAALLVQQYVAKKHPATLHYSSKLFLNDNNNNFYQEQLLPFHEPISYSRLSESDKLLYDAYQFFVINVNHLFINEKHGEKIASFLTETVGDNLTFMRVVVDDEEDAYTLFDSLNSIGDQITSTNLLKNFLFLNVKDDAKALQSSKLQWEKIINAIGQNEFPGFLRYYLNARIGLTSKGQLYHNVESIITTGEDVTSLLEQLVKYAQIYNALLDPEDELWRNDKSIRENINTLLLFEVPVSYPLLMAAYQKFSWEEFKKLLEGIVAISFRYKVIGKQLVNDMERAYCKTANRVYEREIKNAADTFEDLGDLYLPDDIFKGYFKLRTFNTTNNIQKKIARYILNKIECELQHGLKLNFLNTEANIEHIVPERFTEDCKELFTEEQHSKMVYMLGNLTLLEPKLRNRAAHYIGFEDKHNIYVKSEFALTNGINHEEWNMNAIEKRQDYLSKIAAGLWKI